MNRKRIAAIAITAVVTLSSTAMVGFASKSTAAKAKNVVKVAQKNTVANSVKAEPEAAAPKLLNINDDQAIKIAKDAIKYYGDVDPDKLIKEYDFKPRIEREEPSNIGGGAIIDVGFYSEKSIPYGIGATISAVTGKTLVVNVQVKENYLNKAPYDANKVKETAIKFLKDKGYGTNYTSLELSAVDNKYKTGINGAVAEYADGTEVMMEFDNKNYSLFNLTVYNLKQDTFGTDIHWGK